MNNALKSQGQKTRFRTVEEAEKEAGWWVVDATNIPVGRLATRIATVIRGKHRPDFTPHVNGGDFVVVINAERAIFTGNKGETKRYYRHTGYIGGLKETKAGDMLAKKPDYVIEHAVRGMLPEGVLGHRMLKKLKVYSGAEHPHGAQLPKTLGVTR